MGQGLKLVLLGDSWAWGTELLDPNFVPEGDVRKANGISFDFHHTSEHTKYRNNTRYAKLFADQIGADEIIDLSKGGASNDTIVRLLLRWLAEQGYTQGRSAEDIFVSIGWTSPERKDFFYKKNIISSDDRGWFTLYPSFRHDHGSEELSKLYDLYVANLWNAGEYMHRYITQVWQVSTILKSFGINYLMHQAFYQQTPNILKWHDSIFKNEIAEKILPADQILWDSIDPVRFMHKDDKEVSTFHNYILSKSKNVLYNQHPSPLGHQLWAEHMYDYCLKNQLL
jgi:hypothetical protein